jgi:hypothetical protein
MRITTTLRYNICPSKPYIKVTYAPISENKGMCSKRASKKTEGLTVDMRLIITNA